MVVFEKLKSEISLIVTTTPIHEVCEAIQSGEIPQIPDFKDTHYLFFRDLHNKPYRILSQTEYRFFTSLQDFKSFTTLLEENPEEIETFANLLFQNADFFLP